MIKFYPKPNGDGFTTEEIMKGHIFLYADVTCQGCGKVQSVAATHYLGGPCIKCGSLTLQQPNIKMRFTQEAHEKD